MPKKRKTIEELVEEFGEERIKKLAHERAYTSGLTLKMLSEKYGETIPHIRKLLAYAITEPGIISDGEAYLIAERSSLNQYPHTKKEVTFSTKKYYTDLLAERFRRQNELAVENIPQNSVNLDLIYDKISEIETLLASYDDFVSSDQEIELPREKLEKELGRLKKLLESKC